jgi:hypothetical protein
MSEMDVIPVEVTLPLAQQVSDALQGAQRVHRPLELVVIARENEAPPLLITLLSGLPAHPFGSLREVQLSVLGPAPI